MTLHLHAITSTSRRRWHRGMITNWWRPKINGWGESFWPRKPRWNWRNRGSNPQSARWPSWGPKSWRAQRSPSARGSRRMSLTRWWTTTNDLGWVVVVQVSWVEASGQLSQVGLNAEVMQARPIKQESYNGPKQPWGLSQPRRAAQTSG